MPEHLKFAFVSCQNYTHGLYPAFEDLAQQQDVELVVHLGDYIYEEFIGTSISTMQGAAPPSPPDFEPDPNNPHRLFQCNQRGHVRVEVTRKSRTSEHVVVDALQEHAPASTIATFAVEDGKAGAIRLDPVAVDVSDRGHRAPAGLGCAGGERRVRSSREVERAGDRHWGRGGGRGSGEERRNQRQGGPHPRGGARSLRADGPIRPSHVKAVQMSPRAHNRAMRARRRRITRRSSGEGLLDDGQVAGRRQVEALVVAATVRPVEVRVTPTDGGFACPKA